MATRNVTYLFPNGNFASYDRTTEQDQIDEVEYKKIHSDIPEEKYVSKFDVNKDERELIDKGVAYLIPDGNNLIIEEIKGWMLPPQAVI